MQQGVILFTFSTVEKMKVRSRRCFPKSELEALGRGVPCSGEIVKSGPALHFQIGHGDQWSVGY